MQYKVPQNIDQEDKILGPLTFVRLIYLLIGAALDLLAWVFFDTALFLLLAIPITVLTICFAFIDIQDQPFSRYFIAFLLYAVQPKERRWKDLEKEMLATPTPTEEPKDKGGKKAAAPTDRFEAEFGVKQRKGISLKPPLPFGKKKVLAPVSPINTPPATATPSPAPARPPLAPIDSAAPLAAIDVAANSLNFGVEPTMGKDQPPTSFAATPIPESALNQAAPLAAPTSTATAAPTPPAAKQPRKLTIQTPGKG